MVRGYKVLYPMELDVFAKIIDLMAVVKRLMSFFSGLNKKRETPRGVSLGEVLSAGAIRLRGLSADEFF